MKHQFATIIIVIILALFTGALFLYGETVINGSASNNFTIVSFSDKKTSFSPSSKDFSAFDIVISNKQQDPKTFKLSYFLNDYLVVSREEGLIAGNHIITPPQEFLSKAQELKNGNVEYKIMISQDGAAKDYLKKTITRQ